MADVLPIQGPHLMQKAVYNLLPVFRSELPWLTHIYGLVQTVVEQKQPLPMLYRQDGSLYHEAIVPDAKKMSALCFFERNGPSSIRWDSGAMQLNGEWSHPVNMLVWLNLPKIDSRTYDFSDELAADVLRVLRDLGIAITSLETRMERVFERYKLQDHKLLLYPYAGFKIPLTLTTPYDVCLVPFQQEDTGIEYLTTGVIDDFLSI